jgi:apolipoprotein D and lipocalin family protein
MESMRIFALLVLGILPRFALSESKLLTTVAHVDLARYSGTWYEIARYPNRFEKACASDVVAQYAMRSDGKVSVRNSCRKQDGKSKVANGTAKIVDTASNAKLKVTFFWPFYGDFGIIDLAPDYSYAIVGEPSRKYLWILSRASELAPATYQRILERVRAFGYDPAKLAKTPQNAGRR